MPATPDHPPLPARLAVPAFLAIMLLSPIGDGRVTAFITMLGFFAVFLPWVFFSTRCYRVSLIGELRRHHPASFWLLAGFCLSSLLSFVLAMGADVSPVHKLRSAIWYLLYGLFFAYAFLLARLCLVTGLSHRRIFLWLGAGMLLLIVMLLGFYHLADAPNARNWAIDPPVGVHVRIMGMVASIVIVSSAVFLLLDNNRPAARAWLYFCLFAGGAFVVWTASRMSIVVVVITLAVLLLLCRRVLQTPWRRIALMVLVLLASVPASEPFSVFHWSGLQRMVSVSNVSDIAEQTGPDHFAIADRVTSSRMDIWRTAIQQFRSAPWFGSGPYSFFQVENKSFGHPHNIVLQFLVEWGVIGSLLFFGFLLSLAVAGLRRLPAALQARDSGWIAAAAVVFMLTLNGAVDGTYFALSPVFYLATAYAIFPFFPAARRPAALQQ